MANVKQQQQELEETAEALEQDLLVAVEPVLALQEQEATLLKAQGA